MKVGKANVDENPELSGRLLIVSLPTIYHVKNGEFRHHEGSRNLEEMLRYVKHNLFEVEYDPLSWVWHPQSPHMILLGFLFRIAVEVRVCFFWFFKSYKKIQFNLLELANVHDKFIGISGLVLLCYSTFYSIGRGHHSRLYNCNYS